MSMMWIILTFIFAIAGIIIMIISADQVSTLGVIIGLILLIGGTIFCFTMDYCYTKNTYNVEMETQKIITVNGKEKSIRLRIYKDNVYYDIELPIDEYNGETKLSLTQSEISQLKYD